MNEIRLPLPTLSFSLAYQLTASTFRPPMSSVSEASAEVVMPCGHQRRSQVSRLRQRRPVRALSAGTGQRRTRCGRSASSPSRPARPPSRSASASISETASPVRRRWTPCTNWNDMPPP